MWGMIGAVGKCSSSRDARALDWLLCLESFVVSWDETPLPGHTTHARSWDHTVCGAWPWAMRPGAGRAFDAPKRRTVANRCGSHTRRHSHAFFYAENGLLGSYVYAHRSTRNSAPPYNLPAASFPQSVVVSRPPMPPNCTKRRTPPEVRGPKLGFEPM